MCGADPSSNTGNIMKSRLLIAGAVAALLPFAGAVAQTPPPADPATQTPSAEPPKGGATFESLDTDSDGRISRTEAASNASVSEQFSRYDQNANGYIEREEVTSANKTPAEEPKQ
jgi:hypothetical protein